MKTTKLFFMAALSLLMTACSSNDDELTQQSAEQPADNMITITAQLAPKSGDAQTRAMSESGGNIVVDWDVNEQLEIISDNGYTATANIDIVTSGVATISFNIDAAAVGENCTIVYPSTAATATGVMAYADNAALTAQDGTLNANLDVRVGAGTISADNPGTMTVSTQPVAQNAIFKLTLKDINGSADVSAASIVISDQNGVVTTVTPASGYDKVMYVALPTTATTLKFLVTDSNSKKYFNMASDLSLGTNFYPSTVKLATVGDVILSTGKCVKAGTSGAVAMIAYVGSETDDATYKNGLAIALTDEADSNWSTAKSTCEGKTAVTGAKWCLPSWRQWQKMFEANGGDDHNWSGLNTTITTTAEGTSLQSDVYYWTSTENVPDTNAFALELSNYAYTVSYNIVFSFNSVKPVRACLAF